MTDPQHPITRLDRTRRPAPRGEYPEGYEHRIAHPQFAGPVAEQDYAYDDDPYEEEAVTPPRVPRRQPGRTVAVTGAAQPPPANVPAVVEPVTVEVGKGDELFADAFNSIKSFADKKTDWLGKWSSLFLASISALIIGGYLGIQYGEAKAASIPTTPAAAANAQPAQPESKEPQNGGAAEKK